MSVVKEQHITNETARKIFIGILNIKQQITIRKITFIVKVVRNSDDQLPTKLITVWCNHKRRRGLILHTNKTFIVYNIHLVILWGERDHRSQHMGALFLWWKILASFNLRPRQILVVASNSPPLPFFLHGTHSTTLFHCYLSPPFKTLSIYINPNYKVKGDIINNSATVVCTYSSMDSVQCLWCR